MIRWLAFLAALLLPAAAHATGPLMGGVGGGAPTDATFITQTPNATLTSEQALSALSTGLLINTTGTGVLSSYAGSTCLAGAAPRGLDASGAVQNCTTYLTAEVDGSTTNEIQNLFETIATPSGTSPVADSSTDTLTLAAGGIITITGNATTDTITISATEVDGSTTNELQNIFQTVSTPSGTSPVADSTTDTLALAAGGIITITGDSTTDTVTISATEVDGSVTNELQNLFQTISTSSGTSPVADSTTDTLTLTGTAPVTITGDSTTDTITVSLADPSTTGAAADCSANQFMRGIGASLQMSCAQPSASNLSDGTTGSGSVVLNSSPTIITPTIASFTNATHNHQNAAGGGQLDHGLALTGLGDDDHTQYALLAGRSGGQTLIGGTASGDDLTLQSTSNGTKGSIFLDDAVELWPNVPDNSTGLTVMGFTADLDLDGVAAWHSVLRAGPTVHVGQANSYLGAVSALRGDMTILHDDATSSNLPFVQLFWAPVTMTTSVAVAAPGSYAMLDGFTKQATGAITVPSGGQHYTVRAQPTFKSIASATSTWSEYYGLSVAATVGTDNNTSDGTAATVTTMGAVKYTDVAFDAGAGTEAVTTQIAIDIGALANAATNIGMRNADTTVYTPPSIVTVAAGFTLTATATTQKIDATAARTSSVTTAINDGVSDGQDFIIMNVDASGDAITIKTGANTDLSTSAGASGDCVLNQGGVLHVMWSSDRSDWLGISCNSN